MAGRCPQSCLQDQEGRNASLAAGGLGSPALGPSLGEGLRGLGADKPGRPEEAREEVARASQVKDPLGACQVHPRGRGLLQEPFPTLTSLLVLSLGAPRGRGRSRPFVHILTWLTTLP